VVIVTAAKTSKNFACTTMVLVKLMSQDGAVKIAPHPTEN